MASQSKAQHQSMGLPQCFSDFQGAYCTRKLTQFLLSTIFLVLTLVLIGFYSYKFRVERNWWLMSILLFLSGCLLSNILFCFFNGQYWLYAVENYTYNLYFLVMVGYVCKAYVLKARLAKGELGGLGLGVLGKDNSGDGQGQNKNKIIFYSVFIAISVLYTCIFVASMIKQLHSDNDDPTKRTKYCQQVEYLCFDVLCTIMSIIVLVVLHKNQKEQQQKMQAYGSVGKLRPRGSLLSEQNGGNSDDQSLKRKVYSPLTTLWFWIATNVACQIFGLIQSGLLLDSTPPQCLIIKSNPSASNYLDLAFTILTMYLGFAATIWYITLVKLIRSRAAIDRTITYSQEVKVQGNIQLFNPSKEETVFIL